MLQIQSGHHSFDIVQQDDAWLVNGVIVDLDIIPIDASTFSMRVNNQVYNAIVDNVDRAAKTMRVVINGHPYDIAINEPIDQMIKSMGLNMAASKKAEAIKAPMPGMVLKVLVQEGMDVQKGDNLIVLEAMKMENMIKAPAAGTVKKIFIEAQTAVEKGTVLIEMD